MYIFDLKSKGLSLFESIAIEGRVWDLSFKRRDFQDSLAGLKEKSDNLLAVASGDYRAIIFSGDLSSTVMEVVRSRTVRCLTFHPNRPYFAVGDGAGSVVIFDFSREETILEFDVGGRVNVVEFSPQGDFLLVGTDDTIFSLYDTRELPIKVVQEFNGTSFALAASFCPSGMYLALGESESYRIVRLGPLLGVDLVPLKPIVPEWALEESLLRSDFGPSLIQRFIINGDKQSLSFVASTLTTYPDSLYTFNRRNGEHTLETALRVRKIKLLQLALSAVVDGSLDAENERQSILTTSIPIHGKQALYAMIQKYPPEYSVNVLRSLTFVKVPFTKPRLLSRDQKMVCGSINYLDPWIKLPLFHSKDESFGNVARTPAVLPLPGLGTMEFLSALVGNAPAEAFDNDAMAGKG